MRSSILVALSLASLAAVGCVDETVSCLDQPNPICPDASATDAGPRADTNADAPGLDAFEPSMPDSGADAFTPPDTNCGCTDGLVCLPGGGCGCLNDTQCTQDATPVCNTATNTCVPCTAMDNNGCSGTTPVCQTNADPTMNRCVTCLSGQTAACTNPTQPECDVSGAAPACTCTPGSCTTATAARCDETTNGCAPCMSNTDCADVAGNPYCIGGVCRQCTVATEETDCGSGPTGTSCNPATNTCSTTIRGTTERCMPCTFDSQCEPGNTCAAVNPTLGISGNYCLPIRVTACSALRPYAQGVDGDLTDLGGTVNYCRPATTTCEAVRHHRSAQVSGSDRCSTTPLGISDAACGAPSIADGLCRTSGGDNYCTYPCASGSDNDCPGGFTCVVDVLVPVYGRRCSI